MSALLWALGIARGFLFAPNLSLALAVAAIVPGGWVFALFVLLFGVGS